MKTLNQFVDDHSWVSPFGCRFYKYDVLNMHFKCSYKVRESLIDEYVSFANLLLRLYEAD